MSRARVSWLKAKWAVRHMDLAEAAGWWCLVCRRIFASPDRPAHISFSMWSDESRNRFGGALDYSRSPYYSQFTDLRRIVCDDQLQQPGVLQGRSRRSLPAYRGPAWLYLGNQWDWVATSSAVTPLTPPIMAGNGDNKALDSTMAGTIGKTIVFKSSRASRSSIGRPL